MHQTQALSAPRGARLYHGWLVVAAAFLVATFGWGLGFYGPGIYLVALTAREGWSTAELSPAITCYYILGATLIFFWVGPLFDRLGARAVVIGGTRTAGLAAGRHLAAAWLYRHLAPVCPRPHRAGRVPHSPNGLFGAADRHRRCRLGDRCHGVRRNPRPHRDRVYRRPRRSPSRVLREFSGAGAGDDDPGDDERRVGAIPRLRAVRPRCRQCRLAARADRAAGVSPRAFLARRQPRRRDQPVHLRVWPEPARRNRISVRRLWRGTPRLPRDAGDRRGGGRRAQGPLATRLRVQPDRRYAIRS